MKKKLVILAAVVSTMATTTIMNPQIEVVEANSVPEFEEDMEAVLAALPYDKSYKGFTYTEENGVISITGYNGNASDLKIPETINGKKVLYIRGIQAFHGNIKIRSVSMPSILEVGNLAFSDCKNLMKVSMPKVKKIGLSAFSNCGLTSVKLPSVESISMEAFSKCEKLTSVNMPKIRFVGRKAFSSCRKLENIMLSYRISEIQEEAFLNCGADSVKLEGLYGNLSIGKNAFGYYLDENNNMKKISDFKIYGNSGTGAERYAKENGFRYVNAGQRTDRFTLKLAQKTIEYKGQEVKPKVAVSYQGKRLSSQNYTVKYNDNKKTGTATVSVTGKGKYKNCSGFTTFEIIPQKVEIVECKSGKKGQAEISWKPCKNVDNYRIEFCTKADFTDIKTIEIEMIYDGNQKNCVRKNLKSGRKYYVRMNVCDKNMKTSDWSTVKTVVVK